MPAQVTTSLRHGGTIYTLAIDGKRIHEIATVSRIKRSENAKLDGYQRSELLSHIEEFRDYLESESPMIPNAVVIAFDSRVTFAPAKRLRTEYSRAGEMIIPIDPSWEPEDRPGFIVDVQQRLAAVREARIGSFPICVSAFITDDVTEQTEQCILVKSTRPLPKGRVPARFIRARLTGDVSRSRREFAG